MESEDGLRHGPMSEDTWHVCVDMQRMFAEATDWEMPWMQRVLPTVERIAAAHAERTLFTRFMPPENAAQAEGMWRRYYARWESMTLERLGAEMTELVAPLAALVPPALVVDKAVYSPWLENGLEAALRQRGADTLVITGGETDVCVLATLLGAVDRGYRTILVCDALCSSSDETHDALIALYHRRYSQQVETVTSDVLLAQWPQAAVRGAQLDHHRDRSRAASGRGDAD